MSIEHFENCDATDFGYFGIFQKINSELSQKTLLIFSSKNKAQEYLQQLKSKNNSIFVIVACDMCGNRI